VQKVRHRNCGLWVAWALLALMPGCRTAPKLAPLDLSGPGWQVQQGQALWRSKADAPEIAGEVVLAMNRDVAAFVQFSKNPLPLLSAQIRVDEWQIEFIPEKRTISGRGHIPSQLIWLHLLRGIQKGTTPPEQFTFAKTTDGATQIENKTTGEKVTLFLN
jgi:hypothetical protein